MAYYGDYQKDFKKLIDKYSGLTAPANTTYTTASSGGSLTLEDMKKAIETLTKEDHYADATRYTFVNEKIREAMERDAEYGSYKDPYITTKNPLARLFNSISDLIGNNVVYI